MYKDWIWLPKAKKGDIWIGVSKMCRVYQTVRKGISFKNGFECRGNFHWKQKKCVEAVAMSFFTLRR